VSSVTTSVYVGTRQADGRTFVDVDGRPLRLRADFRKASSTSFDWGYEGLGGPAQLSLAILADHLADDARARRYYEHFLRRVVRNLPSEGWILTGAEIDSALPAGGY
jgi:hypothetical protein